MIFGFDPYGWAPYGLLLPITDLSVPAPITALLADPRPLRTYLLYAQPYDRTLGQRVDVKISTDGFASDPDDTLYDGTSFPNALFRAGIITPYNARNSVMSGGQIADGPLPNLGDLVITATRFRKLLQYEWDMAPLTILLGRAEFTLSQFAPIFVGVSASLTNTTTDEIHIPLVDNSYRLRRPLISDTYRGMSAALRGDGSTTYASGTLSAPVGSMTLEMYVRPRTTASTQKNFAGWRNGTSAGERGLRFASTGSNRFQAIVRDNGGTSYTATSTQAAVVGHMYHVAFVLDTVAQTLTLYVDIGTATEQIVVTTVFNAFTISLSNFTLFRLPDASSNFADVDIDEVRIHHAALSYATLKANRNRQIPTTTSTLTAYYKIDEGVDPDLFDSTPGGADLAISGTVDWVGTLEGGPDLAGQTPPCWEGIRRQVQPVLVDGQNNVWEVSRNPDGAVTISDIQDKGAATITLDSPVSDIYTTAPASGHAKTAYMDGRTLLRLETAPQGTLTVTVTGNVLDTAGVVKKLAKTYGGFTDDQIDLTAFAFTTLNFPGAIGNGQRLESRTIWDVMAECARKAGGWVTMTRAGLLTIKILAKPTTPKFYLNENSVQANTVALVSRTQAVKSVRLGYRPYQTVRPQATDLATSLSEEERADLGQQYRYVATPIDNDLVTIRPASLDLEQDTLYDDADVAYTEAVRRQELWGVDNGTWLFSLVRGLFQHETGDEFGATILDLDGQSYLENLYQHQSILVGYTEVPSLDMASLECWGPVPDPVELIGVDTGEALGTEEDEAIG